MNRNWKRLAAVGVLAAVAGNAHAQSSSIRRAVPVFVNGGRIETDALLLPSANRTVVPMRSLFESLGAQVVWEPRERAVYAWLPDRTGVRLGLGETTARTLRMSDNPSPGNWGTVMGSQRLDAAPIIMSDRVYVPLRFASEALRADVRYAAYEPAVYIRTEQVAGERQEQPPVVVQPEPEPEPERRPDRDRVPIRNLAASLELSQTQIPRNGRLFIDFAVENRGNRSVQIPFRTAQHFDIEVLQEGVLIWNWARGRNFAQAETSLTLEPGEREVFAARWDMVDNSGRRVQPGIYTVRGVLTADTGARTVVSEERITVTP